ncbi:MAG: outer membrane beta-barrel protein [Tannerellaceae bacterium]|jgi:hypothetical protein|nr:outer membrane beta-barrel protein [Tannerellaceae bacterium]
MKYTNVLFLTLLSFCVYAQTPGYYVRAGIGTGATSHVGTDEKAFMNSGAFVVEYGRVLSGIEAGIQLSLYDTHPFSDRQTVLNVYNRQTNNESSGGSETSISERKDVSLMLNVGYNLLSLLKSNEKHFFTPYVGYGLSKLTQVDYGNKKVITSGGNNLSMSYDNVISSNFMLGVRYEYIICGNTKVGLYWSYYDLLERDVLGVSAGYTF